MSGRRHHIIPQFLLRGFSSHKVRDAHYAWQYRPGQKPFNSNIINVSVEGHFYTHEGSPEVDDAITSAEGKYSEIVDQLRGTRTSTTELSRSIGQLIAHLEVRTRHLRANFEMIGASVLSRFIALVNDEKRLAQFILDKLEAEPTFLHEEIVREIQSRGLPLEVATAMAASIAPHIKTLIPTLAPNMARDLSRLFRDLTTQNNDGLKAAVRSAQLRALRKNVSPEIKAARYAELSYTIIDFPDESLPLGDSVVIAHVDAPRPLKTFVSKEDQLLALYLPLSPSTALRGSPKADMPSSELDLPLAIAQCSKEFFVAHTKSPHFEILQTRIGEQSTIFSEAELDAVLGDLIQSQAKDKIQQ